MRRSLALFAGFSGLLCSVVAGCSSSNTDAPATDAGADVSTDGSTDAVDPGDGATAEFKHDVVMSMSLTVPPGTELHQCQYVKVPKDVDISVIRIAHQYSPGSHHFLLYETDLKAIPADLTGQYDCTIGDEPVMAHTRGIMYAAQSAKGDNKLPPGVGFTVKAGSIVMFQSHYINPTTKPLVAKVDLGFDTAPAETIKQKAGFLIFYDPFIYLPAKGKAKSGTRCAIPSDINLMNGFTHYHQRGTGMKVYVDEKGAAPTTKPLFETADWEHPADFAGPSLIKAGSTFRFECDYDNTASASEIFQGPNAKTSEMCVFAGLYYPVPTDHSFEVCGAPSTVGYGTKACFDVATCIQGCPSSEAPQRTWSGVNVGPCWQRCIAPGCDGAVDTFLPMVTCLGEKCSAECAAGKCVECLSTKCSPQFTACTGHSCTK